MKPIKERIEEIRNSGYELDFGTVFEYAFENYKKIVVYAGFMILVFSVFLSIIMMTGIISYVGLENLEDFSKSLKTLSSLKIMPLDIAIPLNGALILISGVLNPFFAGFLKMADYGEKGKEFHVSTMFTFYQFSYFINIFMLTFLVSFFSVGLSILFQYLGFDLIGSIISLTISLITTFAIPFIIFGNLNAIEAIKSSIIIFSKQPLIISGLIILAAIGGVIGIFGLFIGIVFTWPFIYSMKYSIYSFIIGIDSESEIEN
ncbi:MAG: hypothetical protein V4572_12160 [Bacteroidota bacterium]